MTYLVHIAIAVVVACPWISEVHPDPTHVTDLEGEFLEVANARAAESLYIYLDTQLIANGYPSTSGHMLFCHPSHLESIPCSPLYKSIPNSNPLHLRLVQGFCRDTIWLLPSIPDFSWQRIDSTSQSQWIESNPSPGYPWPLDPQVQNAYGDLQWQTDSTGFVFANMHLQGSGAQSIRWQLDTLIDTLAPSTPFVFSLPLQWKILSAEILGDDYPIDNIYQQWIGMETTIPLRISEMHKQTDLEPDWIEVLNNTPSNLAISNMKLSTNTLMTSEDSIPPYSYGILTENWQKFVEAFPFAKDFPHGETDRAWNFSYSDTIQISLMEVPIAQELWATTRDPNPLPTPGYKTTDSDKEPKIHSPFVSKGEPSFILHLPTQNKWLLTWVDSFDHIHKQNIDAMGTFSLTIPSELRCGPAHLLIQNGSQKWLFRMVIRP